NHHRNLFELHLKTVQEFLRCLVRIEIHVGVGMSVAAEKLAQHQRVGRVARAHQNKVPLAAIDQFYAPQDEGAHENLAELRISCDERTQALPAELQKFARFGDAAAHEGTPP